MNYPDFRTATGYGTITGLCGINCRHSFYPFDPEVDKPIYTEQKLKELNEKAVKTPDGKEIPLYEATQKQRYLERNLRAVKREKEALEAVGDTDGAVEAQLSVKRYQAKLRAFCKTTGLPRYYDRERA
jgi:hypothetical protein